MTALWQARDEGWQIALRCERRRMGLKSAKPCTRLSQQLHLPSLVATLGPDITVEDLRKRLRCPGCGSENFALTVTAPPKLGDADATPPRRRMSPAERFETLASTAEEVIVVFCDCDGGRRGEYKKETLLAQFDGAIPMPSLAQHIAKWRGCPKARPNPTKQDLAWGMQCRIRYDVG